MATETLSVKKSQSISGEIEMMRNRIEKRAYEIFDLAGRLIGKDLDDWLQAEHELLWAPPIELREADGELLIDVAVPGMDMKDLVIDVTSEDVLIKGESRHEHDERKGKVHTCELRSGSLFRAIHLPKRIDPDKAKAEFKDGMLRINAPIFSERLSAIEAA